MNSDEAYSSNLPIEEEVEYHSSGNYGDKQNISEEESTIREISNWNHN